jgi:hypothetical protein
MSFRTTPANARILAALVVVLAVALAAYLLMR